MATMTYLKDVVTLQLDQQKCNGCMMCITVCPHEVFQLKDKKAFIQHKDQCMECGACEKNCSEEAIKVKAGVGCAAAVISGLIKGTAPSCDCSNTKGDCC